MLSRRFYGGSENKTKFLILSSKQVKVARQRSEVKVSVFIKTDFELRHDGDNSVF